MLFWVWLGWWLWWGVLLAWAVLGNAEVEGFRVWVASKATARKKSFTKPRSNIWAEACSEEIKHWRLLCQIPQFQSHAKFQCRVAIDTPHPAYHLHNPVRAVAEHRSRKPVLSGSAKRLTRTCNQDSARNVSWRGSSAAPQNLISAHGI